MNLTGRVANLERTAETTCTMRDVAGAGVMRQIFEQADRMQKTPAPPLGEQSPAERCIRGALADVEGIEDGAERARRFWASFVARSRAWLRGRDR